MFDQFKMAADMMKGMSPDQISQLMKQAEASKKMLEETVKKVLEEELKKRNLVSKEEVELMIKKSKEN